MRRSLKRGLIGTTFMGIVCITVMLSMCTTTSQPPQHMGGWDDYTDAQTAMQGWGYHFEYLKSTTEANSVDTDNSLIIIMGLETPLNSQEILSLEGYLESGGHVMLLCDNDRGSRLGSIYGVQYEGVPVLAFDFDPELDINASFLHTDAKVGDGYYSVFFNGATGLRVNNSDAAIYATAHPYSVFDYNGDKELGLTEYPEFTIPLVIKVPARNGDIIFISNSGLFSDDMLSRMDNEAFLRALVHDSIGGSGNIYYDDSHEVSTHSPHILYPA